MIKNKTNIILLSLIVILAIFLRTYNIDSTPPGVFHDEANNGIEANIAQLTNNYQWFYPENFGREGLYINLIALNFKLFGVSALSFKLASILMGVLTVIGVYFLSKELFQKRDLLALIASYLTAVSFWSINFSRIAFRAIMMLPILTFSAYFLLKGVRENKKLYYIIGGFIFGLGFHTYIAFRITPFLFLTLIVFFIISQKRFIQKSWVGLVLFGIFSFISAFPIFLIFHQHPEYLSSRTDEISIFSEERIIPALVETIGLSFGKFNFYGDQNWRHNYPPYPILEPIVGIAFAIGVFLSISKFFKSFYQRIKNKVRKKSLVTHAFLLAWFVALSAPEFMTIADGLPHSLRAIGTLPIVYIFAAYSIDLLIKKSNKFSVKTQKITLVVVTITLIYIGLFNSIKYHVYWANKVGETPSFNTSLESITDSE